MAGVTRRRGIISEINVTPLVDIMLVLLIIFMLTAHLIAKQALDVELPQAAQGETPPETLGITLTREGRLHLDGEPVTPAQLRAAVSAAVTADDRAQVLISGDKYVEHGRVVWVVDQVKSLGVTAYAIQIDPTAMTPPKGFE